MTNFVCSDFPDLLAPEADEIAILSALRERSEPEPDWTEANPEAALTWEDFDGIEGDD